MKERMIIGFIGISVCIIAILALAGTYMGIDYLYKWHGVGMAINTATCFVLTGIALILLSLNGRIWK